MSMFEQAELFDLPEERMTWAAYSGDTSPETARELFAKRYGVDPSRVRQAGPVILAGPIQTGGDVG